MRFTVEFKAQVAVAAFKCGKTVAEIARIHGIHATMVTQRKGRLEKEPSGVFDRKEGSGHLPVDVDALYHKNGQIEMERDL